MFIDGFFYPDATGAYDPSRWQDEATLGREGLLRRIYSLRPLVSAVEGGVPTSSSSDPRLMAPALAALNPQPGDRVLEIGTGTGYTAALLAWLVGDGGTVTTLDTNPDCRDRARRRYELLPIGRRPEIIDEWPAGPFDRIIATAGFRDVPEGWWRVAASSSCRLLVPLDHGGCQPFTTLKRNASGWSGRFAIQAFFMPAVEPAPPTPRAVVPFDASHTRIVQDRRVPVHTRDSFNGSWIATSSAIGSLRQVAVRNATTGSNEFLGYGFADEDGRWAAVGSTVGIVGSDDAAVEVVRNWMTPWLDAGAPTMSQMRLTWSYGETTTTGAAFLIPRPSGHEAIFVT